MFSYLFRDISAIVGRKSKVPDRRRSTEDKHFQKHMHKVKFSLVKKNEFIENITRYCYGERALAVSFKYMCVRESILWKFVRI